MSRRPPFLCGKDLLLVRTLVLRAVGCGFYHSIADVVYIFGAWKWDIDLLWFYPIIVIGNYVGCNVRRWLLPETNPSA